MMIDLKSPSALAVHALGTAPGAFYWWYADARDARGDGVVVIAAFGLPFLPGSRLGAAPRERPSLNMVAYRGGRAAYYVLQTYPEEAGQVTFGAGGEVEVVLGRSRITVADGASGSTFVAELDVDLPDGGETLRGRLVWRGPSVRAESVDVVDGHLWCPRSLHAHCRGELTAGAFSLSVDAAGYVDSNFSSGPLQNQGIEAWSWGRVWMGESTLGYYVVTPEGEAEPQVFLVEQGAGGELRHLPASASASSEAPGLYGLISPRRLTIASERGTFAVVAEQVVDDGPFYQRFFLEVEPGSGVRGHGVGEFVKPARVDVPWQRPFVRMRTHNTDGPNSPFLPLFSGPTDGRVGRLVASLRGGRP